MNYVDFRRKVLSLFIRASYGFRKLLVKNYNKLSHLANRPKLREIEFCGDKKGLNEFALINENDTSSYLKISLTN